MDIRRGSRINTDPFPKRAPKTQASRGAVQSMFPLEKFFWLNSLSPRSWISDSFRQDIGQTSTWKVLFLLKLFISKKSDQFLQSGGNLFGSALGHNDLTSMTSGKLHWENGFVCFETFPTISVIISAYQVMLKSGSSRREKWTESGKFTSLLSRDGKKRNKQNKTKQINKNRSDGHAKLLLCSLNPFFAIFPGTLLLFRYVWSFICILP